MLRMIAVRSGLVCALALAPALLSACQDFPSAGQLASSAASSPVTSADIASAYAGTCEAWNDYSAEQRAKIDADDPSLTLKKVERFGQLSAKIAAACSTGIQATSAGLSVLNSLVAQARVL